MTCGNKECQRLRANSKNRESRARESDEKRRQRRQYDSTYRATEHGKELRKATEQRYELSPKGKEVRRNRQKVWRKSSRGKEWIKSYAAKPVVKENRRLWIASHKDEIRIYAKKYRKLLRQDRLDSAMFALHQLEKEKLNGNGGSGDSGRPKRKPRATD